MRTVLVETRVVRDTPVAQLGVTADEAAVSSDDIKVKLTVLKEQ